MGESNSHWGELAARDDELAQAWDGYERLPDPGENDALDAFVQRKNVNVNALVRVGARLADHNVLAFAFPGGIKFRDMVTDKRWSWAGSTWTALKIVPAGAKRARVCIVAEGETDGARLTMLYPDADVAVLPAGADPRPHAQRYAAQLNEYELVLLGQDNDKAGADGAALLAEHLTTKQLRWLPPAELNDWGSVPFEHDAYGVPPLPDPDTIDVPVEQRVMVSARDLLAIEPPEIASHFEQAVLPVGGQMVLHGALKSYKSMIAFDLCGALAQSQPWCGFEPTDEPVRVCVMQYEIPWIYYRERVMRMANNAVDRELFLSNFLTWTPFNRPRFIAGNTVSEDAVLRELEASGVSVFCLDPIRRATGAVDLNAEKDVRAILHFFQRVQDLGITVITTHHDNKAGARQGGGDPLDMTGSGAFGGDADSIVSVAIPKGHDLTSSERNLHFLLRNAPSPSARSMRMTDAGIEYELYPVGESDDESSAQPTPGSDEPSI